MLQDLFKPAQLILDDGSKFYGLSIGTDKISTGELVFNTSMTGYIETLTDPSFFGQIIVQTFPSVGNYGVNTADLESNKPWLKGFIVRNICNNPSNFRNDQPLIKWLKQNDVAAIANIDTRILTKKIRDGIVKTGTIITGNNIDNIEIIQELSKIHKTFHVDHDAVAKTSTKTIKTVTADDFDYSNSFLSLTKNNATKTNYVICVLDCGVKQNIIRNLAYRCSKVIVMPYNSSPDQIKQFNPDGIVLTNGPGDPADNKQIIQNLQKIQSFKIPIFGICLGHQLLALANGSKTKKLTFGHRGSNQPVLETKTQKMYITCQNHGYVVDDYSLNSDTAEISFRNVNDNTCEGLDFLKFPAFSVQFHPEACAGPNDANFLFDKFFNLITSCKNSN